MMVVAIIRPFFYQFGTTMDAIGKPQLNFWFNLLLMIINLSFTYLGLKFIGPEGVAYASVAYHILGLVTYLWCAEKAGQSGDEEYCALCCQ